MSLVLTHSQKRAETLSMVPSGSIPQLAIRLHFKSSFNIGCLQLIIPFNIINVASSSTVYPQISFQPCEGIASWCGVFFPVKLLSESSYSFNKVAVLSIRKHHENPL